MIKQVARVSDAVEIGERASVKWIAYRDPGETAEAFAIKVATMRLALAGPVST